MYTMAKGSIDLIQPIFDSTNPKEKFATVVLRGLWGYFKCPDYEFEFKHFPSRTAIFVILENDACLTYTPWVQQKEYDVLGNVYYNIRF